jgi:hypothetical protein
MMQKKEYYMYTQPKLVFLLVSPWGGRTRQRLLRKSLERKREKKMIAEEQYKELLQMTEQIKREETESEENQRIISSLKMRLAQLEQNLTARIRDLINLRQAVRSVKKDL